MTVRRFDSLVIGGGMSGLPLALRAARRGTAAFVERELLGGTSQPGCKTMIAGHGRFARSPPGCRTVVAATRSLASVPRLEGGLQPLAL